MKVFGYIWLTIITVAVALLAWASWDNIVDVFDKEPAEVVQPTDEPIDESTDNTTLANAIAIDLE